VNLCGTGSETSKSETWIMLAYTGITVTVLIQFKVDSIYYRFLVTVYIVLTNPILSSLSLEQFTDGVCRDTRQHLVSRFVWH